MTLFMALRSTSQAQILREAIVLMLATALLAISAKVSIPFYPVPFTMQTFVVVGLGLALGANRGAAAILLYLVEGALGLPVFAGTPQDGIGLSYMMGSTGGYLVGFVLAAYLCGWFAELGWDRTLFRAFIAAFLGSAIIFVPGVLWLGVLFGWDKPIIAWGLTPFIWGGLLKAGLAAVIFPATWRYLKSRGIV
jgi:biotin transport system substrate-specific component